MSRPGLFHEVERIVLCISLCGLVAATVYAQDTPPDSTSTRSHTFHGIYGLGASVKLLNKSYVDGFLLKYRWNDVEPRPDVYSWHAFDAAIARTTKAGKHFILGVPTGINTPKWLYDLGAGSVTLSRGRVPIPWDPTYLQYFKRMIAALSARYGSNPALDGVQITGLNYSGSETCLVRHTNVNDCKRWMHVGYSSSLVVSAFSQILNEFSDDFPNVQLSAAFVNGGFCDSPSALDWRMNDRLFELGGFVAQNNGWNNHYAMPNVRGDQEVYILGPLLPAALTLALAEPETRYLQFFDADLWNSALVPSIVVARRILLSR